MEWLFNSQLALRLTIIAGFLTILAGLLVAFSQWINYKIQEGNKNNISVVANQKIEGIIAETNLLFISINSQASIEDKSIDLSSKEKFIESISSIRKLKITPLDFNGIVYDDWTDFMFDLNQNTVVLINQLYQISSHLDTELLALLSKIENSTYRESLSNRRAVQSPEDSIYYYASFLYEYLDLIAELKKYNQTNLIPKLSNTLDS